MQLRQVQVLLYFILLLRTIPVVTTTDGYTHLFLKGLQAGLADEMPEVLGWQQLLKLLQLVVGLKKN